MKKFLRVLMFLMFLSSIATAQADEAYSSTLKKMFEVSGTENSYKMVINQMLTMFKQQYPNLAPEVWDEMEKDFLSTSLDDLVVMLVPVYKKYMTEADLQEIIAFYETPTGKKFAENTPLIMQESMQVGQQWGLKVGQELEKRMKETAN